MGAGIAETAVAAGLETVLFDPFEAAAASGAERVRRGLTRSVERGRLESETATAAASRLSVTASLEDLAGCDAVIEAAPEDLGVKQGLLASLEEACASATMLATNTSSIPITAIAAGVKRPDRVVGMHFFNPVPRMRLVEVTPAMQTSTQTLERASELGRGLGKEVVVARDGPGFLVNRCGRPFYGEALRLLQDRTADVEQIDRICRVGGGFQMGPFELMDLVGIDVSFAVARSFTELSFGEPRWRPYPIQARMAASGRHGRKTGVGWYLYANGRHRPDDPAPGAPGGGDGRALAVAGTGPLAARIRTLATAAGYALGSNDAAIATIATDPGERFDGSGCTILACKTSSLAAWRQARAIGFNLLPTDDVRLVELSRGPMASDADAASAEELFRTFGLHVEWVRDAPGLVLAAIVVQIVNEACFALGEGVAPPNDIDTAARLGLNYPRGPLEWGSALGWRYVHDTLDGLWRERREERYRPAPALAHAAHHGAMHV
jgi:3-hydroxybutyryl-CoA dehydrogenase